MTMERAFPPKHSLLSLVTVEVSYIMKSVDLVPRSLISYVTAMITLFSVEPYLILTVSGSSTSISEPGRSKKFITDFNTRGSFVSFKIEV